MTHPLWNRFEVPDADEIAAVRLGPQAPEVVEVVAPDPSWPAVFDVVRERLVGALGERALAVEHVGSTSVPELWAKPVIDVDLSVVDSADEPSWLPDLETLGFVLRVREPDWEEHRFLKGTSPEVNLHVWSRGAREPRRHRMFRDWLREHGEDRARYADVKRAVAARGFDDAMLYNNEKAWVVYDIYERIFAADPAHEHEPQPRPTP